MSKFNGIPDNKDSKNQDSHSNNSKSNRDNYNSYMDEEESEGKLEQVKQFFINHKKTSISLAVLGVLILAVGAKKTFFPSDKAKVAFEQTAKNGNKYNDFTNDKANGVVKSANKSDQAKKENPLFGSDLSTDSAYFKHNKVYNLTYVPTLDNSSNKSNRDGALTYINPKAKSLTSLDVQEQMKPAISANNIGNTKLYGFAAFKDDNTDKWVRIPYIQPIPKIDAQYKSYGGQSADNTKKAINNRHAEANKVYDRASKSYTKTSINMGDKIVEDKKSSPVDALNKVSKALTDNSGDFAKPLNYYLQDSFQLPLSDSEAQRVPISQKISYFDKEFFGLVSLDSIRTLNGKSQDILPTMMSNWGLNVTHQIYLYPDKSYIVIDGIAYNYSNVILDLYDNPQGSTKGRKDLLSTQTNSPASSQYITQIYTE